MRKFTVIDLFCGAGGFSHGFVQAGLTPILAVEKEVDFANTYKANFGSHIIVGDIAELIAEGRLDTIADIVIGGPPCQGFSNLTGNRGNDPRRSMWHYFMDVVEKSQCKIFVLENVPNLLTSPEGEAIRKRAAELGFFLSDDSCAVLTATSYGVPQKRRRAFIMGSRLGPISLPKPSTEKVTVATAFLKGLHVGDVPIPLKTTHRALLKQPATGPDIHIGRNPTEMSLMRYRLIPEGGNRFDLQKSAKHLTPPCWIRKQTGGTDLFGRLEWQQPARCTIRCEFYKPEKGRYLHPSEDRPITHWEAARLQTFPDSFQWTGSKTRIAVQIGNAVPPLLALAVGKEVKKHLDEHFEASKVEEETRAK